jgi:hypothetical protein
VIIWQEEIGVGREKNSDGTISICLTAGHFVGHSYNTALQFLTF